MTCCNFFLIQINQKEQNVNTANIIELSGQAQKNLECRQKDFYNFQPQTKHVTSCEKRTKIVTKLKLKNILVSLQKF